MVFTVCGHLYLCEQCAPGVGNRCPGCRVESVSTFYRHWSDFMTTKDFSWADLHNTAAAPNRKYRRPMDAENSKARKLAKKEFNEQVRELAGFIRKRDKRVAARAVEEAKIRQEKEEVEREKREKLERLRQYEEAEWLHNSRSRSGRRRSGGETTRSNPSLKRGAPLGEQFELVSFSTFSHTVMNR